jgi:hypothetical protein
MTRRGNIKNNLLNIKKNLSQSAGLTLRLHEAEDIVLTDGTLDVSDDRTGLVVNELNADLSDTTTGTGAAENLDDLGQLNRSLSILDMC